MNNNPRFNEGDEFKSYKSHPYIPLGTVIRITSINYYGTYNALELNKDKGKWRRIDEKFLLEYFKPNKTQINRIKRLS